MLVIFSKVDVAGSVLTEDFIVGGSGEGASSEKKKVEDKTQTEQVTDRVVFGFHVLDIDDFWSNVAWGSASDEEILANVGEFGETEVSDNAIVVSFLSEE